MNFFNKLLQTDSFALLLFAATTFASTDTLSLKSCVEIALKKNPQLVVAKGNKEISVAAYETARSNLLPQVSLFGDANRQKSTITFNDTIVRNDTVSQTVKNKAQYSGNLSAGVQGQWQLFDFGKTYAKVAGTERSLRASESDAISSRQSVLISVCTAYYNCLAAKALREVSVEALKVSESHLDQSTALLEAGKGVRYDVIRAEVDVENNKLALIKAENGVQMCRLTLANAIGATLADTLNFRDTLTGAIAVPDLETARKTAIENRPEILSAKFRREAAQKAVTSAECSRYPAISTSASAGEQSPITPTNWQNNWSIGLELTVPLYQGAAIAAAIRQAKGGLMIAEGNLSVAEQTVSLDVEQQYLGVKAALSSIDVAKKTVEATASELEITQEHYKVGSGNPLEISDAELAYANAKISYIQALTDLNNSNVALQHAMGTLTEDFVK
jgi:TolC family type I secretion outer membrane protein